MGHKNNIPTTSRDFYFSTVGDNGNAGFSQEVPVADPAFAITLVNALVPPVSIGAPASITASQSGTYFDPLVMPDFTAGIAPDAAVVIFSGNNLTCGNSQAQIWGNLSNFSDNGVNVMIDGKQRVTVELNSMVVGSDGSGLPETTGNIAVDVKGACEDVFVKCTTVNLLGKGAIGVSHTATTDTPIIYTLDKAQFFNEDQCLVHVDSDPDEQIEVNLVAVRASNGVPLAGTNVLNIVSGVTNVKAQSMQAESIATVGVDGTLSVEANGMFGTVLVEGDCQISTGLFVGDITVEAGGLLTILALAHFGNVTNNGGTLNGIINGVRYGTYIVAAEDVTYDNTFSKLVATDVQGAIDELAKDYQFAESLATDLTSSTYTLTPITKLDEDLDLIGGVYEVTLSFSAGINATNRSVNVGLFIDGVKVDTKAYVKESKDVTDIVFIARALSQTFTAGLHNFVVDFGTSGGGGGAAASLGDVRLIVERKKP